MKKLIGLLLLISILPNAFAGECWDVRENSEIRGFSELDDIVLLSFKDAVSCKPIAGATVSVNGEELRTNSKGYAELPLDQFMDIDDELIVMTVEKRGYVKLKTKLEVQAGTVWNHRFSLTKSLGVDKVRFVLQWGKLPRDLDLHLKSDDYHISYQNKKSYRDKAKLDRDDTNGHGPETITLNRARPGKTYKLFVENYTYRKPFKNATVYVYANNALYKTIHLPKTSKKIVDVLTIENGEITVVNKPR